MRKVSVLVNGIEAGLLEELESEHYKFTYNDDYIHAPVSLTMPLTKRMYEFEHFPSFFEGLFVSGSGLQSLQHTIL